MTEPPATELRRIRRLLTAILVCLVIIILALVPGLAPLALLALIAYAGAMVLLTLSKTARHAAAQLWFGLSSLWRQ